MNTFINFVYGYMALWLILFALIAYLIIKLHRLDREFQQRKGAEK